MVPLDPLQEDGFLVVEEEVHMLHQLPQVLVDLVVECQVVLLLILVVVVMELVDLLVVLTLLETQE
jgi:hypothetical protein